jgi:hypothetical protein
MYTNIIGTLDNFSVTKCTFNNSYADHFPFISLQLGNTSSGGFVYSALAQNITISGNTFNCQAVTDDKRAVIAITSTITALTNSSTYPAFPKLVDTNISGNVCNYDQMILVSTVRTIGQPITGSMLVCVNCNISENVCGAIGFIIAADVVSGDNNSINANVGAIRDKSDQLSIENNSCKLITNLDSVGQYIEFNASWVNVGSGAVSIARNTCNWILVGVSVWENGSSVEITNADGVLIDENRLSPANPAFLAAYQDINNSGVTPPSIGISLGSVVSGQTDYAKSQSIISGNILNTKTVASQSNGTNLYFYSFGIKCYASAIISNNTISNVCSGSGSALIYLDGSAAGGPNIICNDNLLTRGKYVIGAYVQGASVTAINAVSITNNIFDSPTVDGGTNTNTGLNIGATWAFVDNINQALEDISAGGLNFVDARSIEFVSQHTQLVGQNDVNCIYVKDNVLGFNDGGGNFYPISLISGGGGNGSTGINFVTEDISSNQTILPSATYNWIDADTTSGAITITLPTISTITPMAVGRFFYFNDVSGTFGSNNLIISVTGGSGNSLHIGGQNGLALIAINWSGATGLIYTDGYNSWYIIPFNEPAQQSSIFNSGITVGGAPAVFNSQADFSSGATFSQIATTFNSGATFNDGVVVAGTEGLNVTSSGGLSASTLSVSTTSTFAGDVTANGSVTIADDLTAGNITANGEIQGNQGLVITGQSIFNGVSTFIGAVNTGCTVLYTPGANTIGNAAPYSATYTDATNAATFQIVGGADITAPLTILVPPRVGTFIFDFTALAVYWTTANNIKIACTVSPSTFITVSSASISEPTMNVGGSSYPSSTVAWSTITGHNLRVLTLYCNGTNLFIASTT